MSGDWIKMRFDLQTHPKIVRIMSATNADRFRVIGGLHAAWCVFDVHSRDGILNGYTPDVLDTMIGWPGLSHAMMTVGWLEVTAQGIVMPDFLEHNGRSAKRRAEDSARKRIQRMSGDIPQDVKDLSAKDADNLRTREEKRREEERDMSSAKPTTDTKEAERVAELTKIAVDAYNTTMTGLPKVALVNDVRRRQVRRCLPTAREICRTMFGTPRIPAEFWPSYFAACQSDDFCAGRTVGTGTHANWRPDFEYLTRADVMTRIFDRASEANR
jgi:hypothetical protein